MGSAKLHTVWYHRKCSNTLRNQHPCNVKQLGHSFAIALTFAELYLQARQPSAWRMAAQEKTLRAPDALHAHLGAFESLWK